MEITIRKEEGFALAIEGIGYSFNVENQEKLVSVAHRLADKDGGHNKFLESMMVWLEIKAARYWWQEFDTYRVGTTKQSESTIHTITKKLITQKDFSHEILPATIVYLNSLIKIYNSADSYRNDRERAFELIKANLPEGYEQKRMVCTNYKVLRNIIWQRRNHRLEEWHIFIRALEEQLEYSHLLFKGWERRSE